MVARKRLICPAGDLVERGQGVRFDVLWQGRNTPAFVVRFQGKVYGYLNVCGHVPIELDYQPGAFFDYTQLYLICSTHGALYDPASGRCLGGRCNGHGLTPLRLLEEAENVYLIED